MWRDRLRSFFLALITQLVRIRIRLLVINLVAVLVPVVGIEWARTFEREALKGLERDMLNQVQLLRTLLEQNLDEKGQVNFALATLALETIARRTRTRVRLLDRQGVLIADSHAHGAPEGPELEAPIEARRSLPRQRASAPAAKDQGLLEVSRGSERGRKPRADRLRPRSRSGYLVTNPKGPSAEDTVLARRREVRAARRGQLGTATRIYQRLSRVYLFLAMPIMVQHRVAGIVYVTRSTTPVLTTLYHLRQTLLTVLLIAIAITALMSLFLAATISGPLARLTRTAGRIAQGERSLSLALKRRDEIGQLAQAFDTMVQQLDSRTQYIAELAANISHEFKTPLASIRGAAELLVDGADRDTTARQRFLHNILADVERMNRLVSRLLELSRIEASLEPREPFDLGELLEEVAQRFVHHPILLRLEHQGPLPLHGHRRHLESALMALVENAIYFSPPDTPVILSARTTPTKTICLQVMDQGPGISPGNQEKIFARFFTTEADQGGTGLGLAIVAAVVKAHGGEVTVQSVMGQGSTFSIHLPR